MGEHRSRIGATLLASVAVFGAAAASTAANNAAGWDNPFVIGLLVAAFVCLVGSILTFGVKRPRPRKERLRLTVTGCVLEELPGGSTVLQLYVTALNRGEPTTLTDWELVGKVGEGHRKAVHIRDREPLPGRPVRPSLVAVTSTKPLPTGEDDGLVWFAFPHASQAALEASRLTLRVRDSSGRPAETLVDFPGLAAEGRDTIRHGPEVAAKVEPMGSVWQALTEIMHAGSLLLERWERGEASAFMREAGEWAGDARDEIEALTDPTEAALFMQTRGNPDAQMRMKIEYIRDKLLPKAREGYWPFDASTTATTGHDHDPCR
jgi:hypothetical protein